MKIFLLILLIITSIQGVEITSEKNESLKKKSIKKIKVIELDNEALKKIMDEESIDTTKRFFCVKVFRGGKLPSDRLLWFEMTVKFKNGAIRTAQVKVHVMATQSEFDIVSVSWPFKVKSEPESYKFSKFVYK